MANIPGIVGASAGVIGVGIAVAHLIAYHNKKIIIVRNKRSRGIFIRVRDKNNMCEQVFLKPGEFFQVELQPVAWSHWWCTVWPRFPESDAFTSFPVQRGVSPCQSYDLKDDGIYEMNYDGTNYHFLKGYE